MPTLPPHRRAPLGLLGLLAIACTPQDPKPTDDTDTDPVVDSDPAVDSDPPQDSDPPDDTDAPEDLTVTVLPAAPAFDDDLHCTPSGPLPPGDVAITWHQLGHTYIGPTTTTDFPEDTIPHLEQAGGETWACTLTITSPQGDTLAEGTSPAVTVEPPVPMVAIPPGTYTTDGMTFGLSRTFLMGIYEVRIQEFETWTDHHPDVWGADPNRPPWGSVLNASAVLFDTLSVADGLEPCFQCTGPASSFDWTCTTPEDLYACEGYRFPTLAEWEYAAREAGAHDDMLPAGGNFSRFDWEPQDIDAEVTGPNAPPDSTVSDQCRFGGSPNIFNTNLPSPVGERMPNALGLYDLCGNAEEHVFTEALQERTPTTDEYSKPTTNIYAMGGGYGSSTDAVGNRRVNFKPFPVSVSGARLTRTLTPRNTAP